MTALALDKQLEICNAVNAAIAKGKTIKVGEHIIDGIVIEHGRLKGLIGVSKWQDEPADMNSDVLSNFYVVKTTVLSIEADDRIVAVKAIEIETDVIYEPIADASVVKPDLSNSKP